MSVAHEACSKDKTVSSVSKERKSKNARVKTHAVKQRDTGCLAEAGEAERTTRPRECTEIDFSPSTRSDADTYVKYVERGFIRGGTMCASL